MARVSRSQDAGTPAVLAVRGTNCDSTFRVPDALAGATIESLIAHGVYVDRHRADFVKTVVRTLDELQRGTCAGRKHLFVLGGVRDVGKSTLLRNLVRCAALHLPPRMVLCYVNLKSLSCETGLVFSPVEHITSVLSTLGTEGKGPLPAYDPSVYGTTARLHAWLRAAGLSVLLVVDDVEVMYEGGPSARLAACVSELYTLGDIDGNRNVSVVLSGSSPWLRRLLYRTLECGNVPARFPGYAAAVGLSSNRYIFHRLHVVATLQEQARCLKVVADPRVCKAVADNEELALTLFMRSRGLVGSLTKEVGRLVSYEDNGEPARGTQPAMIANGAGSGAGAGARPDGAASATPIESQASAAASSGNSSVSAADSTNVGEGAVAGYLAQCRIEGSARATDNWCDSPLAEAAHAVLLRHTKADARLGAAIIRQGLPAMTVKVFLLALGSELNLDGRAPVALLYDLEDAGVVRTGHERLILGGGHSGGLFVSRCVEFVVRFPHAWMLLRAAFKVTRPAAEGLLSAPELASLLMPGVHPASQYYEPLVAESLVHHSDKLLKALGLAAATVRHLQYAGCDLTFAFGLGDDGCASCADDVALRSPGGFADGGVTSCGHEAATVSSSDGTQGASASRAARGASSDDAGDLGRGAGAATKPALVIVRAQVQLGSAKADAHDVEQWTTAFDNGILVVKRRLAAKGVAVDKCRFLRLWWVSRSLSGPARRLLSDDVAGGKGLVIHRGNMRKWWSPRVLCTLKHVLKNESSRARELRAAYGFKRNPKLRSPTSRAPPT